MTASAAPPSPPDTHEAESPLLQAGGLIRRARLPRMEDVTVGGGEILRFALRLKWRDILLLLRQLLFSLTPTFDSYAKLVTKWKSAFSKDKCTQKTRVSLCCVFGLTNSENLHFYSLLNHRGSDQLCNWCKWHFPWPTLSCVIAQVTIKFIITE